MKAKKEIWKTYPLNSRFEFSSLGRVRRDGKAYEPWVCPNGYFHTRIGNRNYRIHRMLLLTFKGPPPKGYIACHKNDIKTDNRLCNLYWGTPKDNARDSIRNGKFVNSWKRQWCINYEKMRNSIKGNWIGRKHKKSSKLKMRNSKLGTRLSTATKNKISAALRKRETPSTETRLKISNSLKGREFTAERRMHMSIAAKKAWEKRRNVQSKN